MKPRSTRNIVIGTVAVALAALFFLGRNSLADLLPQEEGAAPTRVSPQADRSPGAVPPGKHLLIEFLQLFADATGEPVYLAGQTSPDREVTLKRALKKLTYETAAASLKDNGLSVTREKFRDEDVYWVREKITLQRKRGSLVRRDGSRSAAPPRSRSTSSPPKVGRASQLLEGGLESSVRVFQSVDGSGTHYLVTIETTSQEEAQWVADTVSAILVDRKKKKAK